MISDNILAAMCETNRIFSEEVAAKRNVAMLDRIYTANARILPPGAGMVSGRENIKAFWAQALEALNVATGSLETVEAELLGDAVVEIGRATLVSLSGESVAVKYVVQWAREDGEWKWNIDIWNLNA